MRYFTNFYIICNTDTFGLDFKKIITDYCKFHTICLHFDDFENSFHTFNPNDIVFIYLQSKEETQKTYRILEDVDFNSEVFLYSPTCSLFFPFHKKIHILNKSTTYIDMLAQMEPHIRQFSRSDYLSITADAYIQEVIHNIGIDRRLTAYRYIKFMLNYALKHMYITEGLYLHAFAACKIHFEVNDSVLEKSLRDAIDTAYDREHFNDAFLFLLHYNIHNHKSTNTKFMECAMHYCMQHLKDCLTISKG